jgi:hypothetical protein
MFCAMTSKNLKFCIRNLSARLRLIFSRNILLILNKSGSGYYPNSKTVHLETWDLSIRCEGCIIPASQTIGKSESTDLVMI